MDQKHIFNKFLSSFNEAHLFYPVVSTDFGEFSDPLDLGGPAPLVGLPQLLGEGRLGLPHLPPPLLQPAGGQVLGLLFIMKGD